MTMPIDWPADAARVSLEEQARPRSAVSGFTALTGIVVAALAVVVFSGSGMPGYESALIIVLVTAGAMALVEVLGFKAHHSRSSGLLPAAVRPLSIERTARKLLGFWGTIGALAFAYWLLPEYAGSFYDPVRAAAVRALPWVVVLSPVYIAFVDRRQAEPEDIYAQIGRFMVSGKRPATALLWGHVRGWLIKGFFLPLMFVSLVFDLNSLWKTAETFAPTSFADLYPVAYSSMYLFDVLFACIGYLFTFRVLDSHIRSAEPTMLGWVVCLMCYQPMWSIFDRAYLDYGGSTIGWEKAFAGMPTLYLIWGCVILMLVALYVWATVSFGLRFSNITNRGIITSGPYRWLKHPAYVSKNLSWWLISLPPLTAAGWQVGLRQGILLLLVNGIYAMRAWTEERHLSADPDYRAYSTFMREHGLFAHARRAVAGIVARRRPSPSPQSM